MAHVEHTLGGLVTFPQLATGYGLVSGLIGAAALVPSPRLGHAPFSNAGNDHLR